MVRNKEKILNLVISLLLVLNPFVPLQVSDLFAYDVQSAYTNAVKMYETGQYDLAYKGFNEVLQRDPDNKMAALYVKLMEEKGLVPKPAADDSSPTANLTDSQVEDLYIAAKEAYSDNDFLKAKDLFAEVLKYKPNHQFARMYLDEIASKEQHKDKIQSPTQNAKSITTETDLTQSASSAGLGFAFKDEGYNPELLKTQLRTSLLSLTEEMSRYLDAIKTIKNTNEQILRSYFKEKERQVDVLENKVRMQESLLQQLRNERLALQSQIAKVNQDVLLLQSKINFDFQRAGGQGTGVIDLIEQEDLYNAQTELSAKDAALNSQLIKELELRKELLEELRRLEQAVAKQISISEASEGASAAASAKTNVAKTVSISGTQLAQPMPAYAKPDLSKRDRKKIKSLFGKAVKRQKAGDYEEALRLFTEVVSLDELGGKYGRQAEERIAQITSEIKAMERRSYEEQQKKLERLKLFFNAQDQYYKGNLEEAKNLANKALQLDPGFIPARQLLDIIASSGAISGVTSQEDLTSAIGLAESKKDNQGPNIDEEIAKKEEEAKAAIEKMKLEKRQEDFDKAMEDVEAVVDKGDYVKAMTLLSKLKEKYPEKGEEIEAKYKKLRSEYIGRKETEVRELMEAGDIASLEKAVRVAQELAKMAPDNEEAATLAKDAQEKYSVLKAKEEAYKQRLGEVEEKLKAKDFEGAQRLLNDLEWEYPDKGDEIKAKRAYVEQERLSAQKQDIIERAEGAKGLAEIEDVLKEIEELGLEGDQDIEKLKAGLEERIEKIKERESAYQKEMAGIEEAAEFGEYEDAVKRLAGLKEKYPEKGEEIEAKYKKLRSEYIGRKETEVRELMDAGDIASLEKAVRVAQELAKMAPDNEEAATLAKDAQEKYSVLKSKEEAYQQRLGEVEEKVKAKDFDGAQRLLNDLEWEYPDKGGEIKAKRAYVEQERLFAQKQEIIERAEGAKGLAEVEDVLKEIEELGLEGDHDIEKVKARLEERIEKIKEREAAYQKEMAGIEEAAEFGEYEDAVKRLAGLKEKYPEKGEEIEAKYKELRSEYIGSKEAEVRELMEAGDIASLEKAAKAAQELAKMAPDNEEVKMLVSDAENMLANERERLFIERKKAIEDTIGLGDYDEAKEMVSKAMADFPDRTDILAELAKSIEEKKAAEFVHALETRLEAAPNNMQVLAGVLKEAKSGLSVYPSNSGLISFIRRAKDLIVGATVDSVKLLLEEGGFDDALKQIDDTAILTGPDERLSAIRKEVLQEKREYQVKEIIKQAEAEAEQANYEKAIALLNNGLSEFPQYRKAFENAIDNVQARHIAEFENIADALLEENSVDGLVKLEDVIESSFNTPYLKETALFYKDQLAQKRRFLREREETIDRARKNTLSSMEKTVKEFGAAGRQVLRLKESFRIDDKIDNYMLEQNFLQIDKLLEKGQYQEAEEYLNVIAKAFLLSDKEYSKKLVEIKERKMYQEFLAALENAKQLAGVHRYADAIAILDNLQKTYVQWKDDAIDVKKKVMLNYVNYLFKEADNYSKQQTIDGYVNLSRAISNISEAVKNTALLDKEMLAFAKKQLDFYQRILDTKSLDFLQTARSLIESHKFNDAMLILNPLLNSSVRNDAIRLLSRIDEIKNQESLARDIAMIEAAMKINDFNVAEQELAAAFSMYGRNKELLELKSDLENKKRNVEINRILKEAGDKLVKGDYAGARTLALTILRDIDGNNQRAKDLIEQINKAEKNYYAKLRFEQGLRALREGDYRSARAIAKDGLEWDSEDRDLISLYDISIERLKAEKLKRDALKKTFQKQNEAIRMKFSAMSTLDKRTAEFNGKKTLFESDVKGLVREAKRFLDEQRYDNAILTCKDILKIDPSNKEAQTILIAAEMAIEQTRFLQEKGETPRQVETQDQNKNQEQPREIKPITAVQEAVDETKTGVKKEEKAFEWQPKYEKVKLLLNKKQFSHVIALVDALASDKGFQSLDGKTKDRFFALRDKALQGLSSIHARTLSALADEVVKKHKEQKIALNRLTEQMEEELIAKAESASREEFKQLLADARMFYEKGQLDEAKDLIARAEAWLPFLSADRGLRREYVRLEKGIAKEAAARERREKMLAKRLEKIRKKNLYALKEEITKRSREQRELLVAIDEKVSEELGKRFASAIQGLYENTIGEAKEAIAKNEITKARQLLDEAKPWLELITGRQDSYREEFKALLASVSEPQVMSNISVEDKDEDKGVLVKRINDKSKTDKEKVDRVATATHKIPEEQKEETFVLASSIQNPKKEPVVESLGGQKIEHILSSQKEKPVAEKSYALRLLKEKISNLRIAETGAKTGDALKSSALLAQLKTKALDSASKGEYKGSLEYAKKALEIEPADEEMVELSKRAEDIIKKEEKLQYEEQAVLPIETLDEEIGPVYTFAKKLYAEKKYDKAIVQFQRVMALEENTDDKLYTPFCRQYIDLIEEKAKDGRRAVSKSESEVIKNEIIERIIASAKAYEVDNNYDMAIAQYKNVLFIDPNNDLAKRKIYALEKERLYLEKKDLKKAIEITDKEMLNQVIEAQKVEPNLTKKKKSKEELEKKSYVEIPEIKKKLQTKVSASFEDVPLVDVIKYFSETTGVNIIPSASVINAGHSVTFNVKDIPLESALKYLLRSFNLTYTINNDAVWVSSEEELESEPMVTKVYKLNKGIGLLTKFSPSSTGSTELGSGASISEVKTLKDLLQEAVDWPGGSSLVLDERTGSLIVTNTPAKIKVLEEILWNLDVVPMQVLIEARFLEVEANDLAEIGVEWKVANEDWAVDNKAGSFNHGVAQESGLNFSDFANASQGFNLTYKGILTKPRFEAVFHALKQNQKTKTLSSPRIATMNNQTASIKVVDEWIYPTRYEYQIVQFDLNGDGDYDDAGETRYQNVPTDFVKRDVGIILNVTPSVGSDRKTISLSLVPEVSTGTADYFEYTGGVSLPKFSSRTLNTNVVVENTDTVVLGGLIKEISSKTLTKVPILGDVPVFGGLFRKNNDSIIRMNLLIFVTASILDEQGDVVITES